MTARNPFFSLSSWFKDKFGSQAKSEMTIGFADVCRSTELFEIYGDVRAREIVARTLDVLMDVITSNYGDIIKEIGDEVMFTFTDNAQAVQAACDMHKAIKEDQDLTYFKISVKVGLHYGEALIEKNDIFGDAVNIAARMVSLAKADQIIITRPTVDQLPSALKAKTRSYGKVTVRGKQEQMEIIEVIWQDDTSDLTMLPTDVQQRANNPDASLLLHYNEQKLSLNRDQNSLMMGRDSQNHLSIDQELVSRNHAVIEFRKGKFVLIDKSTNGTYVCTSTGQKFFIHREEMHLYGRGIISLGKDVNSESPSLIYYKCSQ